MTFLDVPVIVGQASCLIGILTLQGESWPFFRPNFKNMDTVRKTMGVDEVSLMNMSPLNLNVNCERHECQRPVVMGMFIFGGAHTEAG